MKQGWIKLHRTILDNKLWLEEKFTPGQAWVDLLLQTNHKTTDVWLGVEVVLVEAGSFITSQTKLATRWGWSRWKVEKFLSSLEHANMITQKTDSKKTTVYITNWEEHQTVEDDWPQGNEEKPTVLQPQANRTPTDDQPQTNTNKNDQECIKNDQECERRGSAPAPIPDKFQKLAENNLETAADQPWTKDNSYINAGRRPMKNYPHIRITAANLADVLRTFDESGLAPEHCREVFRKVQRKLEGKQEKGEILDFTNAEVWLSGWALREVLDQRTATNRLLRSEEVLSGKVVYAR